MAAADTRPLRLAVLLPVTSRPSCSSAEVLSGMQQLATSLAPAPRNKHNTLVLLGIDSDDDQLMQHQDPALAAFTDVGCMAEVVVFSEQERAGHPPGAVCHLWGLLAAAAVQHYDCNLAVLLGDDTEVQPAGWVELVMDAFATQPQLMVLLLEDAADPGFPSFPVLRVDRHLAMFGRLLPECFVNQGGDPFLAALWRRFRGCLGQLQPPVSVFNRIGGVERSDQPDYTSPRYERHHVGKERVLQELRVWQQHASLSVLAAESPAGARDDSNGRQSASTSAGSQPELALVRQLAVDVLVPTYRLDLGLLQGIVDTVLGMPAPPGSDLHLVLVVDRPATEVSPAQAAWLAQLQATWGHRVRMRLNGANLGASATRNMALQESLAEFVVMWDDDIKPDACCLSAYVRAFAQHPQARGFAGPSFIPVQPSSLWCTAVHMADVLFFWPAAADWQVAEVMPWAVTANVAFANTGHQFDLRFPKTGGGEDIDFCLAVTGGKLVPVPEAVVRHPLWNNGRRCYSHFFGWAVGDSALVSMYPQLCYVSWPVSAEACGLLLLVAGATAVAAAACGAAAGLASTAFGLRLGGVGNVISSPPVGPLCVAASKASLAAALAYKAADIVLDVFRAFTPERVAQHPASSPGLRAAAAVEASLIKSWSEAGRLWGHLARGEPLALMVCRRFDWFCGLCPAIVAGEQARAGVRFGLCCVAAVCGAVWAARI